MARLKNRRKRKRILRRVLHVCVILAVLFVAAKGAAFIGKDSSEPIEKAVVMNVFGKDGHDAPEAKEVSAVLTDREAYPQDYLDALENNPELLPFVKGYPDADKTATGGLEKKELGVCALRRPRYRPFRLCADLSVDGGRWPDAESGSYAGCGGGVCRAKRLLSLRHGNEVESDDGRRRFFWRAGKRACT